MPTRLPRPRSAGRDLAIAAGHPLAVQAGLRVAAAGGNAVDAAAAAAFALAVVLPDACGMGGDALLIVRDARSGRTAFNGVGCAPAGLAGPIPEDGAGAAAVPGFVAGLADAHAAAGRLPLADVVAPAVDLAGRGVPVTRDTADALESARPRLERGGALASAWFHDGGSAAREGELVRQPALAETLTAVAVQGPAAFYGGGLADAVAAAVRREGGWMAASDLASHATVVREPVTVGYRDATVHVQPPSSQAILLAMALARLDREPPAGGSRGVHRAVEAIVAAFTQRDRVTTPGAEDDLLRFAREVELPERASGTPAAQAYNHTTAVCAASPDGSAVSMLISVFDEFGCATYVPEGGFFLNDRLLGFSRTPGSPNGPEPGKRPVHTLSPALIEREGLPLALSTPGADGQVQTLLQLVLALVDDGEDPARAVLRPRWRTVAGRLAVEEDLAEALGDELAGLGHELDVLPFGDGLFGSACLATADPAAGTATAWADPRRESWAGAW